MSRTNRDNGIDSKYERFERKYSKRKVRANEREFCTRAKIDEDVPLSCDVAKKEPVGHYYWTGYWRPINRWLNSHIGENWNEVHSMLVAKLRAISAAANEGGIESIIRGCVDINPDPISYRHYYSRWNFYVDDNGILKVRNTKPKKQKNPKVNIKELTNWISGRVIGLVDGKPYWFIPVIKGKKYREGNHDKWKCEWSNIYYYRSGSRYLQYFYLTKENIMDKEGNLLGVKDVWKYPFGLVITRQDRKLSLSELAYWDKIPKLYKDEILKWSPTNKTSFKNSY